MVKYMSMKNEIKNKKSGFIELIVIVIVILLIMSYYGITLSGIVNWVESLFRSALR